METCTYMTKRARQLAEATEDRENVFVGVEVHIDKNTILFEEGRVLEADDNFIIIDIRKTLKSKLLECGYKFQGILILKVDEFNVDNGFIINDLSVFITD